MKNSLFITVFLLSILFIFAGCHINKAAISACEALWQYQTQVIMENDNLTNGEKEAWMINIMQGLGYSDDKIVEEIKKLRDLYKWEEK